MRKNILSIVSIVCIIVMCLGLSGCKWLKPGTTPDPDPTPDVKPDQAEPLALINGGFESADLSGWTALPKPSAFSVTKNRRLSICPGLPPANMMAPWT